MGSPLNNKGQGYLSKEVGHSELVLLTCHVDLDLCVGVVDDGQEHVDEYEEHEEHIQHEVEGSKDSVGSLQLLEVKVTEDYPEQSKTVKIE